MHVLMLGTMWGVHGHAVVMQELSKALNRRGIMVSLGYLAGKPSSHSEHLGTYLRLFLYGHPTLEDGTPGQGLKLMPLKQMVKSLNGFDLVHSHTPLAVAFVSTLCNRPLLYQYHGIPQREHTGLTRWLVSVLALRFASPRIDCAIALNETGRAELERYSGRRVDVIVANGVDTDRFRPNLEKKHRVGYPQFLFVGALRQYKAVDELINVVELLVPHYPRCHLQVAGQGPEYGKLKAQIREKGLENNVTLLGYVRGKDLPYYYSSCDVYTSASRDEAFPLPLLEAMACRKPVVASNIASHRELIAKSKAGLVYRSGDVANLAETLHLVLDSLPTLEREALNFAGSHSWVAVAEKIHRIYDRLA